MENLNSGVKGDFAEQRLELGEGADTKYYNYAGMMSISEVFMTTRKSKGSTGIAGGFVL